MSNRDDAQRAVIRRHSKSFSLAARLLAPPARRHAELLYAWCRTADDAVDRAESPTAARAALARLRADLDRVYCHQPTDDPATAALACVVDACQLPRHYPEELLAGMEMDLDCQRYATFEQLLLYCHRVAGVVGLMMCHALGVRDERALPHAAHLGIAMQLTNIARDVGEDWARGRLYLPLAWLAGEPPPHGQPLPDELARPALIRTLQVARRYYASGERGLAYLDARSRLAVRTAARVYAAIGERIARRGYRVSAGRAVVSRWRKLQLLMWSGFLELGGLLRQRVPVRQRGPVRAPQQVCTFEQLLRVPV
jgi:phytoene synthase